MPFKTLKLHAYRTTTHFARIQTQRYTLNIGMTDEGRDGMGNKIKIK